MCVFWIENGRKPLDFLNNPSIQNHTNVVHHKTIRRLAVSMDFYLDLMRIMGSRALQCMWLVRNLLPIHFGHTVDEHASNRRLDPVRLLAAPRSRTLECFLHFSLWNLNKNTVNNQQLGWKMFVRRCCWLLTVKWIQCFACAKWLQRLCLIVHFFVLLLVSAALTRARQWSVRCAQTTFRTSRTAKNSKKMERFFFTIRIQISFMNKFTW